MWSFNSKEVVEPANLVGEPMNISPPPIEERAMPCYDCGVLVVQEKLETHTEVYVTIGEPGIMDVNPVTKHYCSRCVPPAQMSLHMINEKGEVDETRDFTFVEGWIQDLDSKGEERWLVSSDVYMAICCEHCGEPTSRNSDVAGKYRYCDDHRTKQSRGG